MAIEVYINGKYRTIEEKEDITHILQEKASSMVNPAFHIGDLSEKYHRNGGIIADSLQYQLNKQAFGAHGSGVFFASQLDDVLDWKHNHIRPDKGELQLYVVDLEKYNKNGKTLLSIDTLDDSDRLGDFFYDLGNLVRTRVSGDKGKQDAITRLKRSGIEKISDFVRKYEDISNILGSGAHISNKIIKDWAAQTADNINKMIISGNNLRSEHNISTLYLKELGYSGVDLSHVYLDDSVARGSIVFDIDKMAPFEINFKDNEELALDFFKMVRDTIIERKIPYIQNKDELDEMIKVCYQSALPDDRIERVKCISKYEKIYKSIKEENKVQTHEAPR